MNDRHRPDGLPEPRSREPDRSSSWAACKRIYVHLNAVQRRQAATTAVLLVLGAAAELATIGAVLPFLAVITPGGVGDRYGALLKALARVSAVLGLSTIAAAAIVLIVIAGVATAIRLLLVWVSQKMVFDVAHELARQIYDNTLQQPYSYHVARNSSEALAGIEKVQFVLGNVLLPAMSGITAAFVGAVILIGLVAIDPVTAVTAGACFVGLYGIVSAISRKRLYRNADFIAVAFRDRIQVVQEGLGGIRDVILDRSQAIFSAKFNMIDSRFRHAQAMNQFIGAAPRYVVEAGGIVLVAITALVVAGRPGGIVAALPMLGALALGAQRLLPMIQQVYFSWTQIEGARGTLADVADLLDAVPPQLETRIAIEPLRRAIEFCDVSFSYEGAERHVLHRLNLVVPCGTRIGLVGKSGSGKSTFVDLLMGLLVPESGEIRVDGTPLVADALASWQAQISHVPQTIFLTDGSIASNIAFGRDLSDIDMDRVHEAARLAELHDHIASLPDGYDTIVGERGVRLSGGQRQRIGIARAMYKQARVLVLDEATSALDAQTEASVMAAIERLPDDLTVITIAHRTSTLSFCDFVLRVENGGICRDGRD